MKKRDLRVVLDLHRAIHQIALRIDGPKGADVTQAEAVILAYVHPRRSATLSEIHRAFGHRRSTLTSVVDRLLARGVVTRTPHPDDRRSLVVTLTRRGAAVASECHKRLAAIEAEALENVSSRDIAKFRSILARFAPERGKAG
jgi:DNA-binding MarR family transcriptional regulator